MMNAVDKDWYGGTLSCWLRWESSSYCRISQHRATWRTQLTSSASGSNVSKSFSPIHIGRPERSMSVIYRAGPDLARTHIGRAKSWNQNLSRVNRSRNRDWTHLSAMQQAHHICFLAWFSSSQNIFCPLICQLSAARLRPKSSAYITPNQAKTEGWHMKRTILMAIPWKQNNVKMQGRSVIDITIPMYSQPCSMDPESGVSNGGQTIPQEHTNSKFTMS